MTKYYVTCCSPSSLYTNFPALSNSQSETSWARACLEQMHASTVITTTTAAFFISSCSSCPIILMSKADFQFWEASIVRISLIIWDPTLNLVLQSAEVHHVCTKYIWRETRRKAHEYITKVKITVAFHLLTYSYLPHFPTSTPLYFPLTLANLSRQWVVGIYFHLVVVLESPFSKQHDIIKCQGHIPAQRSIWVFLLLSNF